MNAIRKTTLIFFWALLPTTGVFLQDLHIYYDLWTDSVVYKRKGKVLDKPLLKKGAKVVFHLTEYNPFIHEVEMEVEEKDASSIMATGGNMLAADQGMPGMTGIAGNPFAGLLGADGGPGGMPLMEVPLLTVNDNPITLQSLFNNSRGSAEVMDQANTAMRTIQTIIEEVQVHYQEMQNMQEAAFSARHALVNLEQFKTHPGIRPSIIKKWSQDYYEAIFRKEEIEESSFQDVMAWQQMAAAYAHTAGKLQKAQESMNLQVRLLQLYSGQLAEVEVDDSGFSRYKKDLIDFQKEATQFEKDLGKMVATIGNKPAMPNTADISNLQLQLAEVLSQDFVYRTEFETSRDVVEIHFTIREKSDTLAAEDRRVIKEKTFQITARGGLKVSPSLGVNFGRYFDPALSYSVSNDAIVSEPGDVFLPVATSFIHFYSYSGKEISLGGTFGVGFPLSNSDDGQSVQFFLGPSLVFGSSQRLVITTGLMGGRVSSLGRGLQEGDFFDPSLGDLPLNRTYQLGYFLGASFNLGM